MLDDTTTFRELFESILDGTPWGSPVEIERQRRMNVAAWAYAYEIENAPLVDDATFDAECRLVQPEMDTGNDIVDKFFRENFSPHTGIWVYDHPNKAGLKRVVETKRNA